MTEEKKTNELSETAELAIARIEGVKPQLVAISRSHYGLYHRLLKHLNCAILEIKQLEGVAPVVEQVAEDEVKKQVPKDTGAAGTTVEGEEDDSTKENEGEKQDSAPTETMSGADSAPPKPKPDDGEPSSAAGAGASQTGTSLKDKLAANKNKK